MSTKQIFAPYLSAVDKNSAMPKVSGLLDLIEKQSLAFTPWADFFYKPKVSAVAAHGKNCLFLKFYVTEKTLTVTYTRNNDPVYKDSCVEFFVSFDDGKSYFNLEFNAAGVCLAGYGTNKYERTILTRHVGLIRTESSIVCKGGEKVNWELTAIIPFELFGEQVKTLLNKHLKVNFYKCGDDTPEPHFVSWNNIESPHPNFHLPEFFGEMLCVGEVV